MKIVITLKIMLISKKLKISHTQTNMIAQLAKCWAGIPKVVGLIPAMVKHIF